MTRSARSLASRWMIAALGATLVACTPIGPTGAVDSPSPRVPLRAPSVGPTPEPDGALVGAWVVPDTYTQAGQVAAVRGFEALIGRPLDFVHAYREWNSPFPRESDLYFVQQGSTLLLSWNGTDTRLIASGAEDATIQRMAASIKSLGAQVWIRWRWEMNRPNLASVVWSPEDYVAAWRHIREVFAQSGVTNAAWVWCPLASKWTLTDSAAFYPGDDQVDWLCADVYPDLNQSFEEVIDPFLQWARGHPQPIMIGEFGASKGRSVDRSVWLSSAFDFIETERRIKAVAYFDGKGDLGDDADFTLDVGSPELDVFRRAVTNPYFNTRAAADAG